MGLDVLTGTGRVNELFEAYIWGKIAILYLICGVKRIVHGGNYWAVGWMTYI